MALTLCFSLPATPGGVIRVACSSRTAACSVGMDQWHAWPPPHPPPHPPAPRFHGKGIWGVYPDAILPGVHMVRAPWWAAWLGAAAACSGKLPPQLHPLVALNRALAVP